MSKNVRTILLSNMKCRFKSKYWATYFWQKIIEVQELARFSFVRIIAAVYLYN